MQNSQIVSSEIADNISNENVKIDKNKTKEEIINNICQSINIIETKNLIKNKSICCICLNDFSNITKNNNIIKLKNCKHYYCKSCISKWFNINNNCPQCRHIYNDLDIIKNNNEYYAEYHLNIFLPDNIITSSRIYSVNINH